MESSQAPNQANFGAQPSAGGSKKRLFWIFSLFVAVAVIVAAIVIVNRDTAGSTAQVKHVSITKAGFSPATIKIKKGETVMWTNRATEQRQVTADSNVAKNNEVAFDSQEALGLNDSYSFTFENAGTYTYHDALNPYPSSDTNSTHNTARDVKGTVIVEE